MASPLANIEFLLRSSGRAEVLASLRTSPRTVGELRSATEATRTTVGRALDDLEAKHWVVWRRDRYELTALGTYLADGLADLVGAVEAGRDFQDAVQWLVGELDRYDPGPFADAIIATNDDEGRAGPVAWFVQTLSGADRRKLLLSGGVAPSLGPFWAELTGTGETDIVADEEAITAVVDALDSPSRLLEAVATGRVTLHRHPDVVPHTVAIADETVSLLVLDREHTPQASVRTVDEVARSAAEDRFEEYLARSRAVSPEDHPGVGDRS